MANLFQSSRLTYREMRPKDLEEYYQVYNDPAVMQGNTAIPSLRPASFKETIKGWSDTNPLFVVVVETEGGAFVGQASLRFEAPAAMRDGELGVTIKRSMWGKGYGTEIVAWVVQHGFRFLGLHRISLHTFESNERAQAVYKKVGFVQEGVIRRARFWDGKWEDVILMGIVEDEFFAKEAGK
ncbi:acyl-CoA N-acyltransferase [Vararia minispora EC-137]|uniref:Acyl-CoA N-acyltransferase n=1 Tax=Vararia minispora EC-137 TaxID=1314806 RepID=A0ACB8QTL5_9AGAM|nr:acyl-CoA N-acyltransferase [Vararia minispora EC-137]